MTVPFQKIGLKRLVFTAFLAAGLLTACGSLFGKGAVSSTLFSESEVNAVGLTRPWFNQVVMDKNEGRISHIMLHDEILYITTDTGHIHVIDGVTGGTLWTRQLGDKEAETSAPAVNSKVVAVLHGAKMIILDRKDGRRLLEFPMQAPPGASPQLGENYLYVPIITGKIFAYPLREIETKLVSGALSYENLDTLRNNPKLSVEIKKKIDKLLENTQIEKYSLMPILPHEIQSCPALGHPIVQPIMGTQTRNMDALIWVTDNGRMSMAHTTFKDAKTALKLMYRISLAPEELFIDKEQLTKVYSEYNNDMNYRPSYTPKDISDANERRHPAGQGGMVLLGAQTGFVVAINDLCGGVDWEFFAGNGVVDPIGLSEEHCYVPTYNGDFYAVSLKNGEEVWRADNIRQFISASPSVLYTLDSYGSLAILDRQTGKKLRSIPLDLGTMPVFNLESDRIYLVAPDGLVQCLHEIGSPEPVRYREKSTDMVDRFAKEEAEIRAARVKERGGADASADAAANPATNPAAPAGDAPAPAAADGADEEEPEEEFDDEENPFN